MLVNIPRILQNNFKENGEQNIYFIMSVGINAGKKKKPGYLLLFSSFSA